MFGSLEACYHGGLGIILFFDDCDFDWVYGVCLRVVQELFIEFETGGLDVLLGRSKDDAPLFLKELIELVQELEDLHHLRVVSFLYNLLVFEVDRRMLMLSSAF